MTVNGAARHLGYSPAGSEFLDLTRSGTMVAAKHSLARG